MSEAVVLDVRGVEKAFGPNRVLRGVDLSVRAGEVHALLGENGAGKTTLVRIMLGVEHADAGQMTLGGRLYAPRDPGEARGRGVVMVPQERTLCLDLSVTENVVLGIEPTLGAGLLDRGSARAVARQALAVLGADRIDLDGRARTLSVADQQVVEIARALVQGGTLQRTSADNASLLILDEPTASLGQDDARRLFERVRVLARAGLAVVLVTHFLGDVRAETDRYTVLRDGMVKGTGDSRKTPPEEIVRSMLGRELESQMSATLAAPPDEAGESPIVLSVESLAGQVRPRRATFDLRRGEILGIAGLVGAGRTELLRLIAGLDVPSHGNVSLRAPKGVGLLSEDRAGEGLMLGRSIAENVTLSPQLPFWSWPRTVLAEGTRWIDRLAIRSAGPWQPVGELSGGNQQKVQIGRLLREDFDVLLIDEPTRGIDVSSKAQVLGLLRELSRQGKSIVLVSSQLEELVTTCDRIAVLRRGELGQARPASEWTEETLLLEASA